MFPDFYIDFYFLDLIAFREISNTISNKYNIPVQVSLERYMKCGIGICGQCCVDDEGLCVCKDGPVFWGDKLKYISEFGKYKRDASGKIIRWFI